jgi:hypothetical protein
VGSVKKKSNGDYRYYRCLPHVKPALFDKCVAPSISAKKIESEVTDAVLQILSSPKLYLAELESRSSASQLAKIEAEHIIVENKLGLLREQERRYIRLFGTNTIDESLLQEELAKTMRDRASLLTQIERLDHERDIIESGQVQYVKAEEFINSLSAKLGDPDIVPLALEALDIKVIVFPNKVFYIRGAVPSNVQLSYANS